MRRALSRRALTAGAWRGQLVCAGNALRCVGIAAGCTARASFAGAPRMVHAVATTPSALPRLSPAASRPLVPRGAGMSPLPVLSSSSWFGLRPELLTALSELGLLVPSKVQAEAIPAIRTGADVLVTAATGTGKTLAYLLPLADRLKAEEVEGGRVARPGRPRSLVVVPTRELALQVARTVKRLCHTAKLSAAALVGGRSEAGAQALLARPIDVLVGTPGRLAAALAGKWLSLSDVRVCVLDEVDTLVDERDGGRDKGAGVSRYSQAARPGEGGEGGADRGFLGDIEALLAPLKAQAVRSDALRAALLDGREEGVESGEGGAVDGPPQYVLVGATLPPHAVRTVGRLFPSVRSCASIRREEYAGALTGPTHAPPTSLRHSFVRVGLEQDAKHVALMEALGGPGMKGAAPSRALVFCNSVASARSTAFFVGEQGHTVACLHGAMPPARRSEEWGLFLRGEASVLVATDAAARGLDVPGLSKVVLFDFPGNAIEYLHRAGRAGRAGAAGSAVSLVAPRDSTLALAIERGITRGEDIIGLSGDRRDYVPASQRASYDGARRRGGRPSGPPSRGGQEERPPLRMRMLPRLPARREEERGREGAREKEVRPAVPAWRAPGPRPSPRPEPRRAEGAGGGSSGRPWSRPSRGPGGPQEGNYERSSHGESRRPQGEGSRRRPKTAGFSRRPAGPAGGGGFRPKRTGEGRGRR